VRQVTASQLTTGVLIGPVVLGWARQGDVVTAISDLGLSMLIVVFMLWVPLGLGLDALVGAFSAGIIVKAFLGTGERAEAEVIESKLEGIGFGFLVLRLAGRPAALD
jgi:Kef-type K+ transport system membrane component KefB